MSLHGSCFVICSTIVVAISVLAYNTQHKGTLAVCPHCPLFYVPPGRSRWPRTSCATQQLELQCHEHHTTRAITLPDVSSSAVAAHVAFCCHFQTFVSVEKYGTCLAALCSSQSPGNLRMARRWLCYCFFMSWGSLLKSSCLAASV